MGGGGEITWRFSPLLKLAAVATTCPPKAKEKALSQPLLADEALVAEKEQIRSHYSLFFQY